MNSTSLIQNLFGKDSYERRRHPRASNPWLRIETQGFAYIARDWSSGGVSIDYFHSTDAIGTFITGEAGWADAEKLAPFTADITRRDADGATILRWLDIPEQLLAELDHVAKRR